MAEGVLGFLGISRQQSFGTATSSWNFIPFTSEGIATTIDQIRRGSIVGRTAEGIAQAGIEKGGGDVTMEPHPILIGHILRGVCGQSSVSATATTSVAGFQDYTHEFIPRNAKFDTKCMLPPYTLQVHRDVTSAFQYGDSIFTNVELNIKGNALVEAKATVMTRVTSIMAASTATFTEPAEWAWNVASVSIAGTAIDFIESLTVSIDQPTDGVIMLDGTRMVNRFVRNGPTAIRVSGTLDFQDLTEFNAFKTQTQRRLLVNLAPAVASGPYMLIDIPKMLYTTFPANIGGPNRISVGFQGTGEFDTTSSYAIRITLTNTQATGYSVI
jgi:hypothetical protein